MFVAIDWQFFSCFCEINLARLNLWKVVNNEHVLVCQTTETVYKIKDNNTPNQWTEVVKLYRQNKEQRK